MSNVFKAKHKQGGEGYVIQLKLTSGFSSHGVTLLTVDFEA